VNVVTCDWDCNKGINNPNGVFSGITHTIGDQKWSRDPDIVQYGTICDTVDVIMGRKGKYFNTLERYHIYKISKDNMNDTCNNTHNPIFETLHELYTR
jgi:hypothetical protein